MVRAPPPPRGNVRGADAAPLSVTAQLPRDLHARYTALRTEHFPPERNYLDAHVTLFHALPAMCEAEAGVDSIWRLFRSVRSCSAAKRSVVEGQYLYRYFVK